MSNNSQWAMYVIGAVESNHKWNSVNYGDPITIGMMQWYGTRAADLLSKLEAGWGTLEASIRASLENHPATEGWWTSRYLNGPEGVSVAALIDTTEGHAAQEQQWNDDYTGNVSVLAQYGFSEDRPQPLIMIMSALHQAPRNARNIANAIGGDSSLDRVYQAILNESVLGRYKTRQDTVYNMLTAWNGTDGPPDFGQTGDAPPPGGSPDPGAPPTESPDPAEPAGAGGITKLSLLGANMILGTGSDGKRSTFYTTGADMYIGKGATPASEAPPAELPPPPPPPPPTGGGTGTTQEQIVNYGLTFLGAFIYTQSPARWKPTDTGAADCSSFVRLCYIDKAGIDVGTYTGAQIGTGTTLYEGPPGGFDRNALNTADLIVINWSGQGGTGDHVIMAMGTVNPGHALSHGGPDNGPKLETLAGSLDYSSWIWVKRYIN